MISHTSLSLCLSNWSRFRQGLAGRPGVITNVQYVGVGGVALLFGFGRVCRCVCMCVCVLVWFSYQQHQAWREPKRTV